MIDYDGLPVVWERNDMKEKIVSLAEAVAAAAMARAAGKKVVFTNGCFDILHVGHTRYLSQAKALGDMLVVGVNSDSSVRGLEKAPERPLVTEDERAEILASLAVVDVVCIFDEPTPAKLVEKINPQILVKGGDWPTDKIVGAEYVLAHGGQVLSIPLVEGHSTTNLVDKIRRGACGRS